MGRFPLSILLYWLHEHHWDHFEAVCGVYDFGEESSGETKNYYQSHIWCNTTPNVLYGGKVQKTKFDAINSNFSCRFPYCHFRSISMEFPRMPPPRCFEFQLQSCLSTTASINSSILTALSPSPNAFTVRNPPLLFCLRSTDEDTARPTSSWGFPCN